MDKFAEVDPLATVVCGHGRDVGLYTSSGQFVVSIILPPFKTPPNSINWGIRVFFLDEIEFGDPGNGRYIEGFNYVVPNVVEIAPAPDGSTRRFGMSW